MSNIEKALEKHKRDLNKKAKDASNGGKQKGKNKENVYLKALVGSGLANGNFTINNCSSKTAPKFSRHDELITSAIEKEQNKDAYVIDSSARHDGYEINTDGKVDFAPSVCEIKSEEQEIDNLFPSIKLNSYNVDNYIVSYYESIGRQVWEGPVMVFFRRLTIMLNNVKKTNGGSVIVFASANQGDGKSLLALNTAITLCKDKMIKVAIIDCNFRKSSINKLLGFSPEKGLSDYLNEDVDIKDASFNGLVPRFTIIPAGNKPSNICELLASERIKHLLSFLKKTFDYIIIDTPPILAFPDAQIISSLSDGVILVIDSSKTKRSIAKKAAESLHSCKILGCIVNKSEASDMDHYGYNYSYYK